MVDQENVEGNVQNSSETPQVMNEQTEVVQTKIDPDEKILSDMFDSGKTEVSINELVSSGFDTSRMAQYSFEIGAFRLSRLLLVSPYKIEKKQ